MDDLAALLKDPETTVAVVGATDDSSKYGYVIYRDLKRKGFNVFAVNKQRKTVDGDPAYATLADIPEKPTIVDFVVPPEVTREILPRCLELGLKNVWVQPGAENPEVLAFLQENDFNYVANSCIMVESRFKGK